MGRPIAVRTDEEGNIYIADRQSKKINVFDSEGGLLPLILFGSNEFWTDLAIVVIWGLGTSLTLILILMGIWERERS